MSERLEKLIEAHRLIVELEDRHDLQAASCARMAELIAQRSSETVEAMERERGLR